MYQGNEIPNLSSLRLLINGFGSNTKISTNDISDYERFLFLIKKYPKLKAVPSKNIDEVWHFHIGNSELYKSDCTTHVGYFLKHKECKSNKEFDKLKSNFQLTNKLWQTNFNTSMAINSEMAFCGLSGDDGGDDGGNGTDTDTSNDD